MKLPRSGRGRLSLEVIELADQERPPMIRIPEYLEKRRRPGPRYPAPASKRWAGDAHAGASARQPGRSSPARTGASARRGRRSGAAGASDRRGRGQARTGGERSCRPRHRDSAGGSATPPIACER